MESKNAAYQVPQYLANRKLNRTNIFRCCNCVRRYLTAIDMVHHLTDEASEDNQTSIDAWHVEDAQIVNFMRKTMQPEIAAMCAHLNTSKEIVEYVKSLYSRDLRIMYNLWVEFSRLQQGVMSLEQYFSTFNPEYEPVRAQILREPKLPSLDEVFGRVRASSVFIPQFSHNTRDEHLSGNGGSCGGHANRGGRADSYEGVNRKCTHCRRQDHTRGQCWDLIGKPF